MIYKMLFLSLLIISQFFIVYSQVCQYYGQVCGDDKDCCGGCCFNNICTEGTRFCQDYHYLCLLHPCIGEAQCKVYQSWEGFEPQVYCE